MAQYSPGGRIGKRPLLALRHSGPTRAAIARRLINEYGCVKSTAVSRAGLYRVGGVTIYDIPQVQYKVEVLAASRTEVYSGLELLRRLPVALRSGFCVPVILTTWVFS